MYIYALKLINNKYYIGKTDNYTRRFEEHFSNNGADWTKKYKPISVIFVTIATSNNSSTLEDLFTHAFIYKYGWLNVRGGQYCKVNGKYDHIEKHLKLYSNEIELDKYLNPIKVIDPKLNNLYIVR